MCRGGRRSGWAGDHRRAKRCAAPLSEAWHTRGMARTRVSTTVDADLLEGARRVRSGVTDAVLIDEALRALLARHRTAELDARYAVYDAHPLDEPDAWGDLASFRQAAGAS
jgi:antitoxin MazE5